MKRYVIKIQTPEIGHYVFVWDRQEKGMLFFEDLPVLAYYRPRNAQMQRDAIERVRGYIRDLGIEDLVEDNLLPEDRK